MLRITCPWCGPRDEVEFRCGGESHIERPVETVTDDQWGDYLYGRKNPRGWHHERWFHAYGCRRWFNVSRNTVTHKIEAIYLMHESPPQGGAGD
jgi:sarcosine oxidase, subunit delta